MKALCVALPLLLLTACGRYADFTLPALSGGNPNQTFVFDEHPAPVLSRDASSDVLNPSVVQSPSGLLNFYSAFDGRAWHTALASSRDGFSWKTQAVILSPDPRTWEDSYIAANGSALFSGGLYRYWYQAGPKSSPRIGLATSSNGRAWRMRPAPVLAPGPYMSWDERAVADPYVIRAGGAFYMYYLGQDRANPPRQRIGLARSADGLHWTKLRANPVLDLDDGANVGEPAVWQSHGFYWMLYTVRATDETRYLRLARSTDGVHWSRLPLVIHGSQPWDSQVICDPTVLVEAGEIRVWFGGGDRPSPDERLDGQIGYGTLRPAPMASQ